MPVSRAHDRRNTFVDVTDRAVERQGGLLGRKRSDMFVVLDRENSLYTAGETVRGRVHIVLTQDVKVKDLVVRFYGFGRVCWDEQRAYIKGSAPSVSCKNSEVHLDYSTSLLKKDLNAILSTQSQRSTVLSVSEAGAADEGIVLPAGNHCFQFEYLLPRSLPSSYDGRWGQVKYVVKAALQRPWKFDIDRETDLNIKALVDLNDEPELARPIGGLSEFTAGVMCIRSGPITVELRIGRRGYVPGDSIQLSADVENSTRYKLYHCRLALVQHVTFRAGRKLRKTCVSVASLDKGDILPNTTAQWNNELLVVPPLPPTSSKTHRNIEIRYTVSLYVKYSSWTDAFCLPVTVSVGTVTLRRQTINTYLATLGYTQTPRSSPAAGRRSSITDANTGRSAARPSLATLSSRASERRPSNGNTGITGNTAAGNSGNTVDSTTALASSDAPRHRSATLELSPRTKLGQGKVKSRSQDSSDEAVTQVNERV